MPVNNIDVKKKLKKTLRNIFQKKSTDLVKKKEYKYEEHNNYDLKINTDCLDFYKSYNKLFKFINDSK